jgi:hypothetical protein
MLEIVGARLRTSVLGQHMDITRPDRCRHPALAIPHGIIALAALLGMAGAPAQANPDIAGLKTFANWVVGCDNTLACQAISADSLVTEGRQLAMSVERGPAPQSQAVIVFRIVAAPGLPISAIASLSADGEALAIQVKQQDARVMLGNGGSGRALLGLILKKGNISIVDPAGRAVATTSLAGLPESLGHIDIVQGRAGTVSALVDAGEKPLTVIPPAPSLVQILSPPPSGRPHRPLSDQQVRAWHANFGCVAHDRLARQRLPTYQRLDEQTTLGLIRSPCATAARDDRVLAVLIDESGAARVATFDIAADADAPARLANGWWDRSSSRLRAFAEADTSGTCGTSHQYAWDGQQFRLAERTEMNVCSRTTSFLRTWSADVRQR